MRSAFAPCKPFTFFALLQYFSSRNLAFSYEFSGAVGCSLLESVKDRDSLLQEETADTSFRSVAETGKFLGLSALVKLQRKPQNQLTTTEGPNMNDALQFSRFTLDASAMPHCPRGNRCGEHRDRRRTLVTRRLAETRHFEDSLVASVSGEQHVFLPVVHEKYAKAAQLINEYVARDSMLFDDPNGPCPQANWMRVEGRTGRCFKSFDFSEFRSSDSSSDGRAASKSYGTWEEAERLCMGFGAHLAALHTGSETRFAHMVLDRRPDACWIGLRRAQPQGRRRHEDPSNGWKWVRGCTGVTSLIFFLHGEYMK